MIDGCANLLNALLGLLASVAHRQSEDNPSSTAVEFADHANCWPDQLPAAACCAVSFAAGFDGHVAGHLTGFFDDYPRALVKL